MIHNSSCMSSLILQHHIHFLVSELSTVVVKITPYHSVCCCLSYRQPTRGRASNSKRKTQLSFYEEVSQKWSQKQPSTRDRFPWQEVINHEQKLQRYETNEEDGQVNNLSVDILQDAPGLPLTFDVLTSSVSPPSIRRNDFFLGNGDCRAPNPTEFSKALEDAKEDKMGDECESKSGRSTSEQVDCGDTEKAGATVSVRKIKETTAVAANFGITNSSNDDMFPWNIGQDGDKMDRNSKISHTTVAEQMLPAHELKRLRNLSLRMVERIKVNRAGITKALVDEIHEKWKLDEVVKVKFEEPLSNNMKRMHDLLERRTGGLVIWRSGSLIVLYRGVAYTFECVKAFSTHRETLLNDEASSEATSSSNEAFGRTRRDTDEDDIDPNELERLLNELGPRFTDWNGFNPIPVDGDKLPAIVNGYKTPQRALPNGVKKSVNEEEMTSLRRSARRVPPHFALGRNSGLQGLAIAMVKLWERSAIAKIAIKRGALNTRNVKMAEELRMLTGGTLLSRNKEFIVFYRGNDFLPSSVIATLSERKKITFHQQENEEYVRSFAPSFTAKMRHHLRENSQAGTLSETEAIASQWRSKPTDQDIENMKKQTAFSNLTLNLVRLKKRLALTKQKVERSEECLGKVEKGMLPKHLSSDVELISDEERIIFRKMGLSMTSYFVVGTRGVFEGTIENMHLHWKHREVVKIIVKRQDFEKVKDIASALEAESGGLLISVDRTSKGYAVIVYRGKNYRRPFVLRSENLLTRRDALVRSIELQRHQALERHYWDLQQEIELRMAELVRETMLMSLCESDGFNYRRNWKEP